MICTKKNKTRLVFCRVNHFHFQHLYFMHKSFRMICVEKKLTFQIKYMPTPTKPKFRFYSNESHIKFQHALFLLLGFVLK